MSTNPHELYEKGRLARRKRIEASLALAVAEAIEELGFRGAIEEIACQVEETGQGPWMNADRWTMRALLLHEAAEEGDRF